MRFILRSSIQAHLLQGLLNVLLQLERIQDEVAVDFVHCIREDFLHLLRDKSGPQRSARLEAGVVAKHHWQQLPNPIKRGHESSAQFRQAR